MNPHVSVITLGVRDLDKAKRFYSEGLGWPIQQEDFNWVCFILAGGSSALALYPWDALAMTPAFLRVALAFGASPSPTTCVRKSGSRQHSPMPNAPVGRRS